MIPSLTSLRYVRRVDGGLFKESEMDRETTRFYVWMFVARVLMVVFLVGLIVALFVFPSLLGGTSHGDAPGPPSSDSGARVRLAECLAQKGVILYSAWWCSSCEMQLEYFGVAAVKKLNVVQCSPPDDYTILEQCSGRGIDRIPTWTRSDGAKIFGVTELVRLAQWSGCSYAP